MKKNVRLVLFLCLSLISLNLFAQQIPFSTEKSRNSGIPLKLSVNIDSSLVRELVEIPTFPEYNFKVLRRLDSIQQSVPLPYNEDVQKYIDIYSVRKSMMGKMLGLGRYYFPIFEKALRAYNIPLEIKYLPVIESAMDPYAVSRVGATGLWQFMFATAKGYGLNIDSYIDERRDPIQASYAAAAYFSDAYRELGDWLLAIAAYNCGTGNVNRAIDKAGSRDFWEIRRFLPQETQNYVPAFIAAVYVMKCSSIHDIKVLKSNLSEKTDTVHVNRFVSLPQLAEALNVESESLCLLNPSYRKKIVNGTTAAPKRLILPKVAVLNYDLVFNILNGSEAAQSAERILVNRPSPASIQYHKVKAGQNLSIIADQYRVEVQDLKVWNKLKSNTIVPGQRLIVGKGKQSDEPADKMGKQLTSRAERSGDRSKTTVESI